jgi:hypothetical protein
LATASENVAFGSSNPKLHSADGKPVFVTFSHFSPYVICGDPIDDANPMTGHATDGLKIEGQAIGTVTLSVSADQGQTWQPQRTLMGKFEHDVTDAVKGRYGWQVKFEWAGSDGLDDVRFTTATQVNQAMYPRLKPGGTTVIYRAASRAVVPVLPNWSLSETEIRHEEKRLRSANVVYSPRSPKAKFAYRTTDNKPGAVVFRIDSPTELAEVSAAVRFGVSVPPPASSQFSLDYSLDEGQNWHSLAEAVIPTDNEYSSGWMYGRKALSAPGPRSALVRANFYNGGRQAGLIDAQLYGLRKTSPQQPATMTFGWLEDGRQQQLRQELPAGCEQRQFNVPTGPSIVDQFVELAAAD